MDGSKVTTASPIDEDRAGPGRAEPPRGLLALPRNVWAVTLTSFLTDISSEMLTWLLPLFLRNVLGAPTAAIGLIEGAAETTASVLKVASGWLSDVLGRSRATGAPVSSRSRV